MPSPLNDGVLTAFLVGKSVSRGSGEKPLNTALLRWQPEQGFRSMRGEVRVGSRVLLVCRKLYANSIGADPIRECVHREDAGKEREWQGNPR